MKTDAVGRILHVIGTVAPMDHAAIARVEAALRNEFGGSAVRIEARAPVTLEQIDAGLRQRKPVAVIAEEVGLSRATIYRMLGKKRAGNRKKRDAETQKRAK